MTRAPLTCEWDTEQLQHGDTFRRSSKSNLFPTSMMIISFPLWLRNSVSQD